MPNKYYQHFLTAREKYVKRAQRPGYVNGWFTFLRHSGNKNRHMLALQAALEKELDNDKAKTLIIQHFQKYPFHNHSFNTYLLDELLKNFAADDWQRFNRKPIVLYQGKLYRGTVYQVPEIAFKFGMIESVSSKKLDDYVSDLSGCVGISTSKNHQIAYSYALPRVHLKTDAQIWNAEPYGYIYEINYRGKCGIDIYETQKQRGNKWKAKWALGKEEVNIVGAIDRRDIVRCWKIFRDQTPPIEYINPNYSIVLTETRQDPRASAPAIVKPLC